MIGLRKEIKCRLCRERTDYDRWYEIDGLIENPVDLRRFEDEAYDYFKNIGWTHTSHGWFCVAHSERTIPHPQLEREVA